MNRILISISFLFIAASSLSQNQTDLIGIPGKIQSVEIVQDDISFYTWSLYITFDVDDSWIPPPIDMPEINLKSKPIFFESCDTTMNNVKFTRHGFHTETDAKKFYKRSKQGNKIILKIEEDDWENYVKGNQCLIHISTTSKPKK